MDKIDARILNLIQSEFPLEKQPYRKLAGRAGIPEQELISRIRGLKKKKIVRRVGGVLNSEKLGYPGVLIAARVPAQAWKRLEPMIDKNPGITHCYKRNGKFNFWFTLQAKNRRNLETTLKNLEGGSGIKFICLPSRKRFKIDFQIQF